MIAWHHNDLYERMYCNIPGGKKISMPRYYKNKIYDEYTRMSVGAYQHQKQQQRINEAIQKMGVVNYENTMEQIKHNKYRIASQKSSSHKNNKL